MERQQTNSLQNFDDPKSEILKKRLLKATSASANANFTQNNSQNNVLLNTLRAPISSSMLVSSVQAPQSSMPITHNLVTHSIAPVKLHANSSPYPLQLSTVHVPVQIPGSTSNINVPVQLSGATSSVPLQIAPVSLPIQVSATTNVPVQLTAGETINVPFQIPASQNIQLTGPTLPSMPLLQNTTQPLHSSIIHVHMGSNPRANNMDGGSEMNNTGQLQMQDQGVQMKMSQAPVSQVQVGTNSTVVQIPNSSSNSIQLTLPNSGGQGAVHLRGAQRPVPHVVYLQTPTGLKSFTSTDVISQASTSGNPPQIIVRRPIANNSNLNLISNVGQKPNIAPKVQGQNKSSILAPANPIQPIVIQKPKANDKMIVPVSISSGNQGKQAIAYLSTVKKPNAKNVENQSILISSNQNNVNSVNTNSNQKLFLTPMRPKIQNTKFILPVTLPATMASKGPIINLQIANGQIQNDPQGNITVMRDTGGNAETSEMPPLQPLQKIVSINGKEASVPQSPKGEKFATSILGSRAEPTGEQGEYTLSIPETNASMNDDIYTVSIADEEDGQATEKSFTLAIPEKGKSLLNRNLMDRNDMGPVTVAAPAILRRSYSDNSDRKTTNLNNVKRRISLCADNMSNKTFRLSLPHSKSISAHDADGNDDHRVPSLFCNEKLDKDLESKVVLGDSDTEEYKEKIECVKNALYSHKNSGYDRDDSKEDSITEEDPPGLIWINGVAQLRGSNLQFQTNEFGMIDLIQNQNDLDHLTNPSAKYHTPLKQRIERSRDKKPTSPEDLYRCDGCGCHGMAAEFITPNFCSVTCQTENQKMLQKKKDRERIEMTKKRNKMKKLLMRKQKLDSDIGQENQDDKTALKQYDSASDSQLSEANLVKMAEDNMVENEKYPWMCGKNGFSWMRYLDFCKARAAPVKLFKDPFPYSKNGFKLGMRLEAIDPEHPAMFCVVSVAEVQGYRLRLHFDGYPDMYDFWVNADSVDIFPPGWCEKNGRALKPPASYVNSTFSWPMYLKQIRAIVAPRQLFPHITATANMKPNSFRTGMKLEAEERGGGLRVATVADMMDGRVLVRLDGGGDFWADPACPYIHPVGWADEHSVPLAPPKYYKEETFSWEAYLAETMSTAAPPRAFKTRTPVGFKPGMKLEVVDKRVPFLIRVATVSAVRGHRVRVSFDGWPDELSCWLDDDSPDIHPVGWCLKTGHPLEPPLTAEELRVAGPCGVGGCRGLGSVRGGANKQHAAPAACPYRAPPPPLPDRLQPRPPSVHNKQPAKPIHSSTPTSDTQREKLPRGRPPKHKRVEEVVKNDPGSDDESLSSGGKRWRASPAPRDPPSPARTVLARHMADLELPDDPVLWSQKETAALVGRLGGAAAGAAAAAARLSGAELLMASCDELVACLRLRLGPAVKVHALVRLLRRRLT